MQNILIFIAIIVFITRLMKKIKKAVPGGDKPAGNPAEKPQPHPYKDKLEEMILNMEEAENQEAREKGVFSQGQSLDPGEESDESSTPFYRSDESFYDEVYKDETETEETEETFSKKTEQSWIEKSTRMDKNSEGSKVNKVFFSQGASGNKRSSGKSMLASLSMYQGMQKAVIYKEILDPPVSSKY